MQIKRGMDKGGHYDVEMTGWKQKGALSGANLKAGWIRECIMM